MARLGALAKDTRAGLRPYQVVAAALLLVMTIAAVAWPIVEGGDDWGYHFPFAARIWGISSASYHFSNEIEARWEGFPKLWEWLQGLFWLTTGSLRGTMLPQIGLAIAYWWIAATRLRLPWALLVLGFFMCPLLMIHYQTYYLDLPTGLCLASAALLLLATDFAAVRPFSLAAIAPALLLGMAGNIKIQGLIGAVAIALVVPAVRLFQSGWSKGIVRLLAILCAGIALASISYAVTYARHGNPFYPFAIKVAGTTWNGPDNPLSQDEAAPPVYDVQGRRFEVPQPVAFALSVTELDWVVRGVVPRYNQDSDSGDVARSGSPSRTGGWGQLFVALGLGGLLVQLVRFRREEDKLQRELVLATTALIVVIAFVPRSHELRYWLFLPLLVIPVNIRWLLNYASPNALGLLMTIPLAYSTAQLALSGNSYFLNRPPFVGMRGYPQRPAAMVQALRTTGRYCDPDEQLFRYSQAVTGQPGLLSQRLSDCPGQHPDAAIANPLLAPDRAPRH